MEQLQAFCIRCKAVRNMIETTMIRYKNNVPVEKGKCEVCKTNVQRMMSKERVLQYEMGQQGVGSEEGDPN